MQDVHAVTLGTPDRVASMPYVHPRAAVRHELHGIDQLAVPEGQDMHDLHADRAGVRLRGCEPARPE